MRKKTLIWAIGDPTSSKRMLSGRLVNPTYITRRNGLGEETIIGMHLTILEDEETETMPTIEITKEEAETLVVELRAKAEEHKGLSAKHKALASYYEQDADLIENIGTSKTHNIPS